MEYVGAIVYFATVLIFVVAAYQLAPGRIKRSINKLILEIGG
jgi:hypothetical protein